MTTNEMTRAGSTGLAQFEPRDFNELGRLAEMCARSGLFAVKSPEAAMVVMLTGASLGLPPVAALRGIHVVQGRAVLSSDLLVAVVLRSGQCAHWTPMEVTATRCVIETQRKGSPAPVRHVWTMDDAKRAKLATKSGPWQEYPAAMLRARCSADLARMVYPDVLFGVYVEGEIESTGEIVSDTRVEAPAARAPHEEFAALLADTLTLADAAALLRRLSQRIHAVGASEIASEHLASWLDARGHVLTATDQRALERGDWPAEMLDVLDALAECETGADVLRWWPAMAPVVDALGAHVKPTKTVVARTYCARENIATTQPARVFAAALAPKPPPTGTDAPTSSANDAATAAATTPTAESTAAAHASRERIASAGGIRAYLRTKGSRREIEAAVRAHGRHVPGLAQIAAERLEAVTPADHDGTRPKPETLRRECERWAAEGPVARVLRAA